MASCFSRWAFMYCCLISSFLFFLSSSALSSSSDFLGPAFCVSNNLIYTTIQMHFTPFRLKFPLPFNNWFIRAKDLSIENCFQFWCLKYFEGKSQIFLQFPMLELHLDARRWLLLNIISYSFGGAIIILLVSLSAAPFCVALFVPRDVRQWWRLGCLRTLRYN